ncbi:MAG: tetratricopeptide repeat protein, partial [Pseudomonadota bacterium]
AAEWMTKAAESGNPQAQYDLGAFYQFGRGLPLDEKKAAEWTSKAADAGLSAAQVEYATMLFKGQGVEPDQQQAAKLFSLAAQKGNPVAQNRLARLYANGIVFPLDLTEAAKWHLIARDAGVSDFRLDVLLTKLTPEQRAAADRFVDAYQGATVSEVKPLPAETPAAALDTSQNESSNPGQNPSVATPQGAVPSGATSAQQPKPQTTTQPKGNP